ncbi:hypothetical protein QZH41_012310, partial [Actinostola sp. cb2023]
AYANNPEENIGVDDPNLFEGDMVLTDAQRMAAEMGQDIDKPTARGGIKTGRWPGGVVPYTIDSGLRRSSRAMNAIRAGMEMWSDNTCITFKERTNEYAYANFYQGGHALGFYHEQSRPDRDQYVTINWNNINSNMKFNFNKYPRSTIDSLGTPYDYGSVMHYDSHAFSNNRRPTIVAKQSGVTLGNRRYLSKIDIRQMNLMYKCSGGGGGGGDGGGVGPQPPPPPPPPGGDCKDTGRYCYYYVPRGGCKNNDAVRQKCKKSCNLC